MGKRLESDRVGTQREKYESMNGGPRRVKKGQCWTKGEGMDFESLVIV